MKFPEKNEILTQKFDSQFVRRFLIDRAKLQSDCQIALVTNMVETMCRHYASEKAMSVDQFEKIFGKR